MPEAECGPGSDPETALQGQVPLEDRQSGRSEQGYRCNMELVGQHQGEGASWVSQSYGDCAYVATRSPSPASSPGVQVLDVSDPSDPQLTTTLTTTAMLGPWESLKVNEERGLLAAVHAPGPTGFGFGFFSVYDIETDCRQPQLLNTLGFVLPATLLSHEGAWSPDGRTYWSTGGIAGFVTAINVANPALPTVAFLGTTGLFNHGLSISNDGNRMYIAQVGGLPSSVIEYITGSPNNPLRDLDVPNGMNIFDVSDIQQRRLFRTIRHVSTETWQDGLLAQHAINISYGGVPHVVFVDEGGSGSARIIDISDEENPEVISKLKLEIHMPEHSYERVQDIVEGQNGFPFGYDAHYCAVDRPANPTALACGFFNSGVRVFDIRVPTEPREIAYFNPPAQTDQNSELPSSEHAQNPVSTAGGLLNSLSADWCSSPPRFVGDDELWVTCQDNGFMALRFTNGAYPLE